MDEVAAREPVLLLLSSASQVNHVPRSLRDPLERTHLKSKSPSQTHINLIVDPPKTIFFTPFDIYVLNQRFRPTYKFPYKYSMIYVFFYTWYPASYGDALMALTILRSRVPI